MKLVNINEIFNWTKKNIYIEEHNFLSFVRKFGDKYDKKLMDVAIKTGIDAVKN